MLEDLVKYFQPNKR